MVFLICFEPQESKQNPYPQLFQPEFTGVLSFMYCSTVFDQKIGQQVKGWTCKLCGYISKHIEPLLLVTGNNITSHRTYIQELKNYEMHCLKVLLWTNLVSNTITKAFINCQIECPISILFEQLRCRFIALNAHFSWENNQ